MTKNSLILYGVSIFIIFFGGYFFHVKIHTCPIPEIDTLSQYVEIRDSTGYEPQIIIFERPVNEDSIYEAAKIWWQSQTPETTDLSIKDIIFCNYVASMDTTYEDSLLTANIKFKSRIVLDPEAYFNLKFKVREKIITNTVHKTETVTYNPYFFIEGGARAGNGFNYFIQAGINLISYRHLKLPIYYDLEHVPDGSTTHSMRVGTRIEF